MSIEERLRDSFTAQVGSPPVVSGLADRSMRRATRVRRAQGAASVVVALIAVAVPMTVRDSKRPSTPTPVATDAPSPDTSASSANTPAQSVAPTAAATDVLPQGPEPKVDHTTDNNLHRPVGVEPRFVSLPSRADSLYATPHGTVVLARAAERPQLSRVYIVRTNGDVDELAANAGIRGIAVDGSRLAYRSEYETEGIGVALVLVDLANGKVLQLLENHHIASTPVSFNDQEVLLANGDDAEKAVGTWDLESNTYRDWDASGGDTPLDAVNGIALVAEGDRSCATVVELATHVPRFKSCLPGRAASYVDRFGVLAPDGQRYAGSRYNQDELVTGLATPPAIYEWPVIGDAATGAIDDRLRSAFRTADLRLDTAAETPLVWEDATHIIAVALSAAREHIIVRCDVDAATCESALNYGATEVPLTIALARPQK